MATASCWPTISLRSSLPWRAVAKASFKKVLTSPPSGVVHIAPGSGWGALGVWLVPWRVPPLGVPVIVSGPVPADRGSLLQSGRSGLGCCVRPVVGHSLSSGQQVSSSQFWIDTDYKAVAIFFLFLLAYYVNLVKCKPIINFVN